MTELEIREIQKKLVEESKSARKKEIFYRVDEHLFKAYSCAIRGEV